MVSEVIDQLTGEVTQGEDLPVPAYDSRVVKHGGGIAVRLKVETCVPF